MTDALLIIDMQNDFMDNGALCVPGALALVPLINSLISHFTYVIASKDWHPKSHQSFAANHKNKSVGDTIKLHGILHTLWPVHCVQNSYGASWAEGLDATKINHVVLKGSDPTIDSYSAFFDNAHLRSTGLDQELKRLQVDQLFICGVATDYCVKFTAFDALSLGYSVFVIEDACKGVELYPGDVAKAFMQMKEKGVKIVSSSTRLC